MDDMDKRNILKTRSIFVIITILLVCAAVVEARVFFSWGITDNIAKFFTTKGGKSIYDTDMNINGSKGHVSIFGMTPSNTYRKSSMLSLSYKRNNLITTLLGIQAGKNPIVFKIERQASRSDNTQHLSPIPPYPQSNPVFFSEDENTRFSLAVSSSLDSPFSVRQYYDKTLKADGWAPPSTASVRGPEGMAVYLKRDRVACISVERESKTGLTRIALLHKTYNIK
ncbi:hypothetical protein BVX97_04760 [bacterium E08(2017)]|nr:hypothetical protein BVX97_04760 [bacterium E08(2017)]